MGEKRLAKLPVVFYLVMGVLTLLMAVGALVVMKEPTSVPEDGGLAYALFVFVLAYSALLFGGISVGYFIFAALKTLQMRTRFRWPSYFCIAFDVVMVLMLLCNALLWLFAVIQILVLIDNVKSVKILREEKQQKETNE